MEKDAPAPKEIPVAVVVDSAKRAFADWVTKLEVTHWQLRDLEKNGIAIPEDTLDLIKQETEPTFRRVQGIYMRSTRFLTLVAEEDAEDEEEEEPELS